ncbi:hypothetical protein B0H66DRAFT_57472 [Apodospora peruviana]|uniref:C2H2-type domain-containing protein n=1 Tax=Apodospora peruviana TaxID=516989 RepID=A0AAE0ISU8_9PEZI|nr:hypothetical protein B0H66DRAFT_57472 [Apodospora peruviana]
MHARDASGRQVSLLNDDGASYGSYQIPYHTTQSYHTPNTPELLRSDSYDSQMSSEPISPLTPAYDYQAAYTNTAIHDSRYDDYGDPVPHYGSSKRPRTFRSPSYDDEGAPSPGTERSGKRYPCRFRESHGCEKTFTTSGHASRHSKIHTAEKGVPCTFSGCSKKFTRADNMKQHLETHYKDKSRSSSSRPSLSSSERKSSSSGKSSSRSKMSSVSASSGHTPLPSPGVFDMRELHLPLVSRPSAACTPSSGLDALAMAIQYEEGV